VSFRPDRRHLILAGALLIPAAWLLARDTGSDDPTLVARATRGTFTVVVRTAGELGALESTEIMAPSGARQAQIYQMRISSLVPEGTVVDSGDVVAELDRSELASKQSEAMLALEKAQAVYEQAMLDSALNLSQAREDIRSKELALEEARLEKEQSVYEPPTVQRQAEINLERAQRALDQGRADYETKTEQSRAKMREVGADVERERNKLGVIQGVMEGFTVRAPAPGMVIYEKEWNGRKKATGSMVNSWDPTVATLPDLSKMESITYVNEIDVRNVAVGQPVTITFDADPTKQSTGTVSKVANVGEQRPNTDAKVFEVRITVAEPDTTLRPGMTTGNAIETLRQEDVLFVPIEALNSEDGVPFVFHQSGGSVRKQEVVTGAMNDNEVVILEGLEEDDRVLLIPPPDRDDMSLHRLENSPVHDDSAATVGGDTALRDTP
jgi:RND family efflux transporter MFP subunit